MLEHLLEQIKALNIEETKNLLEDFGILEFNVLDEENNTILHLAIKAFLEQEKNSSDIRQEGWIEYCESSTLIVKKLVSKMSDRAINQVDIDGFTAMYYASKSDNYNIPWTICGRDFSYFEKDSNILGDLEY